MIRLKFFKGVEKKVQLIIRRLVVGVERSIRIDHKLIINIVPAPAVASPDGGVGFGATVFPKCEMWIAGVVPEECANEAVHFLSLTLAHEFAHYEQFRDSRKIQERGVSVRARTLQKYILARYDIGGKK